MHLSFIIILLDIAINSVARYDHGENNSTDSAQSERLTNQRSLELSRSNTGVSFPETIGLLIKKTAQKVKRTFFTKDIGLFQCLLKLSKAFKKSELCKNYD